MWCRLFILREKCSARPDFFFFFFVVDTDFFFTLAREDGEAGDRAHNMPLRAVFAGWTLKHTMALTDAHLLVKFFRVLLPVKN